MAVGGDLGQVDLDPRRISGLREAMRRLGHVSGVGTVRLTSEDVVRHPLVERILRAWASGEETRHA
jgi:phosphate starvation-inducible PhoH-like protein